MAGAPNPALETWPYAVFGNPLQDPGLTVIDPVVRMPMEHGVKARQRFLNPVLGGTYSVLMLNATYALFQAWHKHKIANGSKWFNFKVRAGASTTWEEVLMVGMYQPQQRARYTQVTFTIVQRTDSIPSASNLDAALL